MTSTPTDGRESLPPEGPDFEVWNHLESGWQMAHDDMARQLSPETMKLYRALAAALVEVNTRLFLAGDDPVAFQRLLSVFPKLRHEDAPTIHQVLYRIYLPRESPWLRHAVELEVASKGIDRATAAIDRFAMLAPRFAQRSLPERAQPYVDEVVIITPAR